MDSSAHPSAPPFVPMARLFRAQPKEALQHDPEPLARLRLDVGEAAVAALVQHSAEDLTHLLHRLEEEWSAADFPGLARTARRIGILGLQIGYPDLHRAARQAATCATGPDGPAREATLARLLRLGRQAEGGILAVRSPTG